MIQYIIAAGIGAFLGSQSKKSKKSYAKGAKGKMDTIKDTKEHFGFDNVDWSELSKAEQKEFRELSYKQLQGGSTYAKGGEPKPVYDNRRKTLEDMVREGDNEVKSAIRAEKAGKISTAQLHEKQATVEFFRKKLNNLAKGGYLYKESDDPDANETFNNKKEVMEFIKDFNESVETNYKSISDFNKGEEYRKITEF